MNIRNCSILGAMEEHTTNTYDENYILECIENEQPINTKL